MIEDKEAYRAKCTELLNKKEELIDSISAVEAVKELLEKYNVKHLSALKAKLEKEYDDTEYAYEYLTKEEDEVFAQITKEFSANQIECWFAQGYDILELVNAYLRGELEKFKEKPNEHE